MKNVMSKIIGNEELIRQVVRYLIVGGIATVADMGTLYICNQFFLGEHYLSVSIACGFIVGLIVNYWMSNHFVFQGRRVESDVKAFLMFTVIGIIGLGINEMIIHGFVRCFTFVGVLMIAKAFATGVTLCWNFCARKYFIYK